MVADGGRASTPGQTRSESPRTGCSCGRATASASVQLDRDPAREPEPAVARASQRREGDSNPRDRCRPNGFQDHLLRAESGRRVRRSSRSDCLKPLRLLRCRVLRCALPSEHCTSNFCQCSPLFVASWGQSVGKGVPRGQQHCHSTDAFACRARRSHAMHADLGHSSLTPLERA